MRKIKVDTTTGTLIRLSLPIILSQVLQTAYNVIDMFWVGNIGSNAVAAVGSASFFINLGWALSSIVTIGSMIKLSHSIGEKDDATQNQYSAAGLMLALTIGLIYTCILLLFPKQLIRFFQIQDPWVNEQAEMYLMISSLGVLISYLNLTFTSLINAKGHTKLSFRSVLYGNLVNMILDPLLIIGFDLGVEGAAWATVFSRVVSLTYFWILLKRQHILHFVFKGMKLFHIGNILKIGIPGAIQRVLFTLIAIIIGRIVAKWGSEAIAAQKLGLQIEALTFMVTGGLQQSVSILVGRAFGAKEYLSIQRIYRSALTIALGVSIVTSIIFLTIPHLLIEVFVTDPATIQIGSSYLRIVGISQFFMALEMVTGGVYNGQGLTRYSATISVVFTSLRIPIAILLSRPNVLGIDGIWWSIAITSILKGIISAGIYRFRAAELEKMELEKSV